MIAGKADLPRQGRVDYHPDGVSPATMQFGGQDLRAPSSAGPVVAGEVGVLDAVKQLRGQGWKAPVAGKGERSGQVAARVIETISSIQQEGPSGHRLHRDDQKGRPGGSCYRYPKQSQQQSRQPEEDKFAEHR